MAARPGADLHIEFAGTLSATGLSLAFGRSCACAVAVELDAHAFEYDGVVDLECTQSQATLLFMGWVPDVARAATAGNPATG